MKSKIIVTKTIIADIDTDKITDTHVKVALEKLINNQCLDRIQKVWISDYVNNHLSLSSITKQIEVSNFIS